MQSVNASFTYRPGEVARALRRVYARRHRARVDSLVALGLLGAGVYLWTTEGFSIWVALACGAGGFLLVMLALVVLAVPVLAERSQAKFFEPYTLSFSAEGIHFRTPSIDSRLSWTLYHSWSEDDEYLYLFYGRRDVSIVPIRAFPSPQDYSRVRNLVSERAGRSAQ